MHVLFIDFADAYGSIQHDKMIETLNEYDIPATYCKIIEHIYEGACFQVICGKTLSKKVYITRGTKTGDPLSVIIFLMIVNRVLQPAFDYALIALNIENERNINPLPLQAYADDIAMISYDFKMLKEMIEISEPLFNDAGLKVKGSKCALFYERRSGNNWYKGKSDRRPVIEIQGEKIETYKRSQAYKYLGKSLSICGEDPKQVEGFIEEFKETIDKIEGSSLPIPLKLSAFNNMALAKILHHFDNTRIEEKQLEEMDSKVSCVIRAMFGLYPKATDKVFFVGRLHGGLGVKKPSNVYRATRISNLIKMLNHEEENIRNMARESLSLDMRSRGVRTTNCEKNFLGYQLDDNDRLVKNKTYGGSSDWPDLLFQVNKLKGCVVYENSLAKVFVDGKELQQRNLKQEIEREMEKLDLAKCSELRFQGKFIGMDGIDRKISHQIYYGWKHSDSLVKFVLRARMNQIPCNQLIHFWNKDHEKKCFFCNHHTESVAHLMNSCKKFKDLYSKRHDRIVDAVYQKMRRYNQTSVFFVNRMAETAFPDLRTELQQMNNRKPDLLEIKSNKKECEIIEVTVCFDLYMSESYRSKETKYQQLKNILDQNGIKTNIRILCFGSLGTVHEDVRKNLRRLGLSSEEVKSTIKWCSVSNMICGNIIWQNRCKGMHGQNEF